VSDSSFSTRIRTPLARLVGTAWSSPSGPDSAADDVASPLDQFGSRSVASRRVVWDLGDVWVQTPSLDTLAIVMLASIRQAGWSEGWNQLQPLQLPPGGSLTSVTEPMLGSPVCPLSEDVFHFLRQRDLSRTIAWFLMQAVERFPGAGIELGVSRGEDEEQQLLSVKVYSSFSMDDFQSRRRALALAVRQSEHSALGKVLSVFQRRTPPSGWQAVPWYRTVSPR